MSGLAGVLFDLDGTLLDSAPDLAGAVNVLRLRRGMTALPLSELRPYTSQGAPGLLKAGFNVSNTDADYLALRDEFLQYYEQHACEHTDFFAGIPALLDELDAQGTPWGIVTNKYERFAAPILAHFGLNNRARAIVCGDTVGVAKPEPEPLWHAAQLMHVAIERSVYIGDDARDIEAARRAGCAQAIAIAYGYASPTEAASWGADAIADDGHALAGLLGMAQRSSAIAL